MVFQLCPLDPLSPTLTSPFIGLAILLSQFRQNFLILVPSFPLVAPTVALTPFAGVGDYASNPVSGPHLLELLTALVTWA